MPAATKTPATAAAAETEAKKGIGLPGLVDAVKSHCQMTITKKDLADLIRLTFKVIGDKLVAKQTVAIPDFGKFDIRHRPERLCHNPQDPTKQVMSPAHDVVVFKPSAGLKDEMK